MELEALFEKSLKKWRKNLYCSVPFIIESLAILGFVNLLSFLGFNQIIDQQTIETAISFSPFLVSSFLMLVLFSSYLEGAGLGSIRASLRKKKKGMWEYGNKFWLKMFEMTLATISLYLLFSVPSLVLLYIFPMSMIGFYVMIILMVLLSFLLFLSKYVLVISRRSVWYSIKRSAILFLRSPKKILKIILIIFVFNLPIFLLSMVFPVIGSFFVGFFTQAWSSYLIFLAYKRF